MLESGGGSIINIASMSGIIVNRGLDQAHYNCSKAGRDPSVEKPGDGVGRQRDSGQLHQPRLYRHADEHPSEMVHQTREFESQTPIQRMAKVEEMAGPALFLASDAASFCTGVDLVVDGGFVCW
jgi:NAD(P)-dependent dehydrogenase (short-subunit alcohol dehydrogenase family)